MSRALIFMSYKRGPTGAMEKNISILQEARQLADAIASSLPDRIQIAALTLKSKLPFKALSIRELLIHRVSPLATAAVDLFERDQVIPAVVLTRAVVETVAVLYYFYERLRRFLDDKNTSELDDFLMSCLFGSRNNPNPDWPASINVLTFVNHVEKTIPGFRAIYDSLCEQTHPNWAGTLGAFGQFDWERFELKLGPTDRTPPMETGVRALSSALMVFHLYYNPSGALVLQLNDYFEHGASH